MDMYTTVIASDALERHSNDPDWVIIDCRYDLADKSAGKNAYMESHIPGAIYADLHDDLSGPPVTNRGRHPLPVPDAMKQLFSRFGIGSRCQVIAYDGANGSFAARLWWMLRYMGHEAVAVLDGGWQAWQQANSPVRQGLETRSPVRFQGQAREDWVVTVENVTAARLLIDSRDPARFAGEMEPVDRVAGHIPGAINRFWKNNLEGNGNFKDSSRLRYEFLELMGNIAPADSVFYCGSGVTACHNLLAISHAGLAMPRLYAGSWSEWCADPGRPIATG
ncbi:MAG: 3-mercaptopyruvate sulfurtransferase [Gammaproteobacteria bacterium RBG_16_51_14]|nr:MAG: 3-mercaptopyruvate sulfurtransferase [Gammaproteobacteria bacterium RBG_16_51_14]